MGYTAKEFEQLQSNRHGKPALPNDANTAHSAQQSAKDEHEVDQSKKSRRRASNEAEAAVPFASANEQIAGFVADFMERMYPNQAYHVSNNVVTFPSRKKKITITVTDL